MNIFRKKSLNELAVKYNTDKASNWVHYEKGAIRGHDYARFYERYFAHYLDRPITIMELGCGPDWNIGASINMLRDYFPKARIIGVDIKPSAKKLKRRRVSIEVGNLAEPEFVKSLRDRYEPDILIDDASHIWSHQILALATLYESLKPGGLYVLEDVNTSFGFHRDDYSEGQEDSGYDFLTRICEELHEFDNDERADPLQESARKIANHTDYVSQYRHTAILGKKA